MRRLKRAHQKYIKEQTKRRRKFKNRCLIAGSAAAITLGSGALLNITKADYTPDPHELVVSQDADADYFMDLSKADRITGRGLDRAAFRK